MPNSKFPHEIVMEALKDWPILEGSGDPNTADMYWHAKKIKKMLEIQLSSILIEKEKGIKIMDFVNEKFIKGIFIREISKEEFIEKGRNLVKIIQENKLLSYSPTEIYLISFYIWHGCINMAKCLRPTYMTPLGEKKYSLEIRKKGYQIIKEDLELEDKNGNPWVKYGVSIAKSWEIQHGKKQGIDLIDYWVPSRSPYWD